MLLEAIFLLSYYMGEETNTQLATNSFQAVINTYKVFPSHSSASFVASYGDAVT